MSLRMSLMLCWLLMADFTLEVFAECQRRVPVSGFGTHYLSGSAGCSGEDGSISLAHNDFTMLQSNHDHGAINPDHFSKLKLLGQTFSFTVDLSKVGCSCNLAVYLVSAPARNPSGNGRPFAGRGDFYCDANQVGGQWCPEIDLMEANNHAFQATPHRCDNPSAGGVYGNCDRGGCSRNTREIGQSFGMGPQFSIDTRRPFTVTTAFPAANGRLVGMRTSLHQDGKEVVLEHGSRGAGYLDSLTEPLLQGMTLVFSYWGSTAQTMAWLDQPFCGQASCSGNKANAGVFRNISVAPIGQPAQTTQPPTTTAAAATVPSKMPPPAATTTKAAGRTSHTTVPPPPPVPAHEEVPAASMSEFDCSDLGPNVLWEAAKQRWCCMYKNVGCPLGGAVAPLAKATQASSSQRPALTTTPAPPPPSSSQSAAQHQIDCDFGYPSFVNLWSETKKEFCCQKFHRGCPGTSSESEKLPSKQSAKPNLGSRYTDLDCFSFEQDGWSTEHRNFCCKTQGVACITTAAPEVQWSAVQEVASTSYDCSSGLDEWNQVWTLERSRWCCQHEGKGCGYKKATQTGAQCNFDCRDGLRSWKSWTQEKRNCCCKSGRCGGITWYQRLFDVSGPAKGMATLGVQEPSTAAAEEDDATATAAAASLTVAADLATSYPSTAWTDPSAPSEASKSSTLSVLSSNSSCFFFAVALTLGGLAISSILATARISSATSWRRRLQTWLLGRPSDQEAAGLLPVDGPSEVL